MSVEPTATVMISALGDVLSGFAPVVAIAVAVSLASGLVIWVLRVLNPDY